MKKLLLTLTLLLTLGLTAAAETVVIFQETFDKCSSTGGNDGSWSGSAASGTLTADNTGWTFEKGYGADKCAKFGTGSVLGYAETPALSEISGTQDCVLTFKAGAWDGKSEKTTLNITISGGGTLDKSSVTLVKGAWSDYEINITGATAATKIKFAAAQAKNNRFLLDEILITAETSGTGTSVAKPKFELVEGDYGFSVAITAEEGADIHYTTDGSEPTAESALYSAPVEVWENTTFKAIAVKDGESSAVATFNAEVPFLLEDFMMLTADTHEMMGGDFNFVVKGEIKVAYQSGSYLYVKCGNSYALLYGRTNAQYENGDTFSRVEGTFTVYNGLPEVKDYTLSDDKTAGTPVQPMALETVEYAGALINSYVTFENVTVADKTITDAEGNELAIFDRFEGVTIGEGKMNITGFVSIYEKDGTSTIQFYPTAYEYVAEFVGVSHNPRIGKTVVNYDYTLHVNNHVEGEHTYTVTLKIDGVGEFTNTEHTLAADEAEAEPAMMREAAFNATHRLNGSIKATGLTGETNYKASMFVEMPNGELHEEPVADFATGTVGITDVAVDEAEAAEYFNLQGVRVAQPEAGNLYIVRRGGKATKELVK